MISENRNGTDHTHSLSGKFIYELNQKTAFINNTLQTNIDWDDIRLSTAGSLPNEQSAKLPDYYVTNKFKIIKRFKGKHLVTIESRNEWESLPQTLRRDTGRAMETLRVAGNHTCRQWWRRFHYQCIRSW